MVMEVNGRTNKPAAGTSGVKMKKVAPILAAAIVFLTGCSSLDLSTTTTTTVAKAVTVVNGYTIEPYANLTNANLTGANLTGTRLELADLRGATMPEGWVK